MGWFDAKKKHVANAKNKAVEKEQPSVKRRTERGKVIRYTMAIHSCPSCGQRHCKKLPNKKLRPPVQRNAKPLSKKVLVLPKPRGKR